MLTPLLSRPLPYTSSPVRLALQDLLLFLQITVFVWPITRSLPSIVIPFHPFRSGPLDELYPSVANLWALFIHLVLVIVQALFLILLLPSLLLGVPVPLLGWTPTCILLVVGFVIGNNYFCILLNGNPSRRRFSSYVDPAWEPKDDEKWVFINGVAVGSHWMQSNLDRLAMTFRRPVLGIHNRTRGILFDTIECIIQRTFGYATPDVREVYAQVVNFIQEMHKNNESRRFKKIVLILHSQGAVEGGLVLDWLFATVERSLLERVEVYTFGSAANHFNSPPEDDADGQRVIRHVEHYANMGDYVSLFGILHFRPLPKFAGGTVLGRQNTEMREEVQNRYVGRLFVKNGSGHQMNGNYLDDFFEMGRDKEGKLTEVLEENDYMSGQVNQRLLEDYDIAGKVVDKDMWDMKDCNGRDKKGGCATDEVRKIKDISRLWRYRNGKSPED